MTGYSLFVLKVPLNTNKPNQTNPLGLPSFVHYGCAITRSATAPVQEVHKNSKAYYKWKQWSLCYTRCYHLDMVQM